MPHLKDYMNREHGEREELKLSSILIEALRTPEAGEIVLEGLQSEEGYFGMHTYEEAGMLTYDDGIVLRVDNREFRITIQEC